MEYCARTSSEEKERVQRHARKLLLFVWMVWEECFVRLCLRESKEQQLPNYQGLKMLLIKKDTTHCLERVENEKLPGKGMFLSSGL